MDRVRGLSSGAWKIAVAVLLVASPACAQLGDAARTFYTARLADSAAGRFDTLPASPLAGLRPVPVLETVVGWDRLRREAYAGSFAEYALFLRSNPDWPQFAVIRRRAEKLIDASVSAPDRLAYFRQFPAQSAVAKLRMAEALLALKRIPEAKAAARAAWDSVGLDPLAEVQLLTLFEADLTPNDHLSRADKLLWSGQTTAAARLLPRLTMDRRLWLLARIAFRVNAPDASNRLTGVPAALRDEPGLLLDQAMWLKRKGDIATARQLLGGAALPPGVVLDAEQWLKARLELARGAWREGDTEAAYRLAARHAAFPLGRPLTERTLGERQQFVESEWLAGWLALRKLNRPAQAFAHFQNVRSAALTPITQTRGDYWTGRAAEAAGRAAEARAAYAAAASHIDYFYGQLAAERLGRTLQLDRPPPLPAPAGERALRFQADPMVLAARALGELGDRSRQTLFLRALVERAQTPDEQQLVGTLARPLNRPDLGVLLAKAARAEGELSMLDLAYPVLDLPASLAGQWSMIHALTRQESQFDRAIASSANARGLMQLLPGTAAETAAKLGLPYAYSDLTENPIYNVTLGSAYFARMRDSFGGSHPLAAAAYNAGPGNVRKFIAAGGDPREAGVDTLDWIEAIPIYETRNYVQRVLENAVMYDLLHPQTAVSPVANRLSWYLGKKTPG